MQIGSYHQLSIEKLVNYAKDDITPMFIDAQIMPLIEDAYTGIKQMIIDKSYKPHRIMFPARSGFLQFEKPLEFIFEKPSGMNRPTNINQILYVTHTAHVSIIFWDSAFDYPIMKHAIAYDNPLQMQTIEVQREDTKEIFEVDFYKHNFIVIA